jgi:hypothetical protein
VFGEDGTKEEGTFFPKSPRGLGMAYFLGVGPLIFGSFDVGKSIGN